jgi:glycosyltransferase involved in cell wall biosynthesis
MNLDYELFRTFVPRMKVLIVNTSEKTGGAAVAANRLTEALINNGVKAKMLVMNKETSSIYVSATGFSLKKKWNFVWERFIIWLNNLCSRKNLWKISIANTGQDITSLTEFREANIIHLHWINQGFLSISSIKKILESGKTIVWTMHDMWEATAICHHSYECERFSKECSHCPFLRFPGRRDLSQRVFKHKLRMLEKASNLHFVTVSEWLANRSRQSALIGRFPITVIPNTISLSLFKAVNRIDARSSLNINEPYVISFGAARIDDPIKGFSYLIEALNKLVVIDKHFHSNDIRLLLFGGIRHPELLQQLPVSFTHLGYINDESQLSLVYSASNVTVSSSLYETFGQTLIEAQACGSVPVSFDGSGQADIIDHLNTGYLAKRLSVESLAEGIEWGLHANISAQQLRRKVCQRYSDTVIANRYIQLYNTLPNTQA